MACLATVALAATGQAQSSQVGQAGPITINESGKASPYPSQITVSGKLGTIERASVRLEGLTHGYPDDLDILLVSPAGKGIVLVSDVGGQNDLNGVTLTITNGAAALPDEGQISSGTYRPTDNEGGDVWPDTTATSFSGDLTTLNGDSPNGIWRLYVLDDQVLDGGTLTGWTLYLATTPVIGTTNNTVTMAEDSVGTYNFSVRDSDTPLESLVFSAGPVDSAHRDTIVTNTSRGFQFARDGTNVTMSITPWPNANTVATGPIAVRIGVSDGIQTVTTDITLTITPVNDAPTGTLSTNNLTIAQGTLSTNLTLTVADVDNAAGDLTLAARSANADIVDPANVTFGGSGANRTLTVAPTGAATGTTQVFIDIIDPSNATNTVTLNVTVAARPQAMFANTTDINIIDDSTASPYPSPITVSGVSGLIGKVVVTLADITHGSLDDLDILLVKTNATTTNAVILMRGAGGTGPVSDLRLTFDPSSTTEIPVTTPPSGTYNTEDYLAHEGPLPAPAPQITYTDELESFAGMDPNGTWHLYVRDHQTGNAGIIDGGWILTIFSAPTVAGTPNPLNINEDVNGTINFTAGDFDGNVTNVTFISLDPNLFDVIPTERTNATAVTSGSVTIDPDSNAFGSGTLRIVATDTSGFKATNHVIINVASVNDLPTASVIQRQITRAGEPHGPVSFTVNDVEDGAGPLTVTAVSDNSKLLPNSNIIVGGSGATRTLTFYPIGNQAGNAIVTVTVTDSNGGTRVQSFEFSVLPPGSPLFENGAAITIVDNTTVVSTNVVSGLVGDIAEVRVTLFGVTHPNPDDLDILLVGPGDANTRQVFLLSDAGDSFGLVNAHLEIFDAATNNFPDAGQIVTGEYQPVNYGAGDTFTVTIPAGTVSGSLSTFNGTNPNGAWRLYVHDDNTEAGGGGRGGAISGGWQLSIETAPTIAAIPNQETQEDIARRVNIVIGDEQPGVTNITVTAVTNNSPTVNLIKSIEISGEGASRTLLITPNDNIFGTNTITVTATDGSTTSTRSFQFGVTSVPDAPSITAIPNQTTSAGTQLGPINFTVSDPDTGLNNVTLSVTSSNPDLIPTSNIQVTKNNTTGASTITLTPSGVQTGDSLITITAADNSGQKSTEEFLVTVQRALAFSNGGQIVINDATTASPYPSVINVQGVEGSVTGVRVALLGFGHTYPDDVDVMLVSPSGTRRVMLMSDAGGANPVSNLRLDFNADAATAIPDGGPLTTGTYRPADHAGEFGEGTDVFPAPAPGNATGSALSGFNGISPNGDWRLFVRDDTFQEAGVIQNGWILILETGPIIDPIGAQVTREDVTLDVPIRVRDSDTMATNLVVTASVSANAPADLVTNITVVGTGNERIVRIVPTANLFGTNLVTVNVTDGSTSASRSFALQVTAVNDVPVITTSTNRVVINEDATQVINFTITDVDSPVQLTNITVVSSNTGLVPNHTNNLSVAAAGGDVFAVTVKPAANQTGTTELTLTARDTNQVDFSTSVVLLEVTPVNDAPTIAGLQGTTKSVVAGSSTTNISFTIGDVETPARNLIVTATSDNQAVVPNANIVLGGSAESRTIQATTIGTSPGTAVISVVVQDEANARTTNTFSVVTTQAPGFTFANGGAITIRETNTASVYPSVINVAGMRGPIHSVAVTIDGLSHTAPDDIDILLVAPDGKKVVLMSDAGGRNPVSNVRLQFVERGASLPDETQIVSGTYVATNYEGADTFPAPAPGPTTAQPYSDSLSHFDGSAANGDWQLFIVDDALNNVGTISFGWSLVIETAPTITLLTATPVNWNEDTTTAVTFTLDDMVTPVTGLALDFSHTNPSLIQSVTTVTNGNNVTATITPRPNVFGTNTMTVVVRRSDGAQSSVAVPMNVLSVNDAQTISRLTPKTVVEGETVSFEFLVNDVDTQLSRLWLEGTSSDTSVISNTNILFFGQTNLVKGIPSEVVTVTLRPNANAAGSSVITFSVIDTNTSLTISSNFTLTVTPFNDPPTISAIPTHAIPAGTSTTNIVFTVADPDSGTLTVTATSSDTNLVRNSDIVITPTTGAPGQRTVRVTAQPGVEGATTIRLTVSDGSKTATSSFVVNVRPSRERLYHNTRAITINDNGPATDYPSTINISDLAGSITKVTVTLNQFAHRYPDDVEVLLVSPTGEKILLMSDAGGGVPVTNLVLRFDQGADGPVPDSSLTSGTYRPTNYEVPTDVFAAPAPAGPYSATLNDLNGKLANGTWQLFVMDDTPSDAGVILNGWTLAITTQPRLVDLPDITIQEDTTGRAQFTVAEESFGSQNFTFNVTSSNPNVVAVNGVQVTGSGTNYTVVVNPVANASGTSTIGVTLTNPDGQSVSDSFVVTVTPVNDIPTITDVADQVITAGTTSPVIIFNYDDVETEKKDLVFTIQSSNTDLIPVGNVQLVGNELRITPVGNRTGSSEITLTVSDGVASNSTTFLVTVLEPANPLFANTDGVVINDNASASPYPSTITVSGVSGTVTKVTVTLNNLTHPFPDDLDVLLVGPAGQKVILMSDAGAGGTEATRLNNVRLTFDDAAANGLPDNTAITNGTYRPTNHGASDTFTAPAPAGPYSATLSAFVGSNANGVWSLFIRDDESPDAGSLGSWLLSIETTAPTVSRFNDVTFAEDGSVVIPFQINDGNTPVGDLSVTASTGTGRVVLTAISGSGNNRNLTLVGIPNASGTDTVTVTVSDGTDSVSRTFNVTVTPVNDAPSIAGLANTSTPANVRLRIPFTVSDPDSDESMITVSAAAARPSVGTVSIEGTGVNRTLVFQSTGTYPTNTSVIVVATDGDASSSVTIDIAVTAPTGPTISNIPDQTLQENVNATVAFQITSPGADPSVRVSAENPALFDALTVSGTGNNRTLLIDPALHVGGTTTVTVTVTDEFGTASDSFVVTIVAVNDRPVIAEISEQTATTASTTVTVPVIVTDTDTPLANLTYSAVVGNSGLVSGVTFVKNETGAIATLTLVPGATGSSPIVIVVRDGDVQATEGFTLTVTEQTAAAASLTVALVGANLNINVTGTPGATYSIEGTSDFTTWTPVGNLQIDADGTSTMVVPATGRMQFFRAVAR